MRRRSSKRPPGRSNGFAIEEEPVRATRYSPWALVGLLIFVTASGFADDACDHLSTAKIPNTTITLAQQVAAGEFKGPPAPFSGVDISSLYKSLPAFCRVTAEAK